MTDATDEAQLMELRYKRNKNRAHALFIGK